MTPVPSPPPSDFLPLDSRDALLVGRLHDPATGPCVVVVREGRLHDITSTQFPTVSDLLDAPDLVTQARTRPSSRSWDLEEVLHNSTADRSDARPTLLAPVDLQVVKAAGVTFARSMLERVVEEQAKGDSAKAEELRQQLGEAVSDATKVRPGSAEADEAKRVLVAAGLWSQYLEVGIGPDPEIFTKAPVLSSVGLGAPIGVLSRSTWNNPEPEVVLLATSDGRPVAATLGNDVNLRDFEGRSALLLTEAKDNNASCALGPFLRIFDDTFTLTDLRAAEVTMRIEGTDGFALEAVSPVSEMSRTFEELVTHTWGDHHQYPDGFVLFTGTMFAPTQDRDAPGEGFTHHAGDRVTIASPRLGALTNVVTSAETAPRWEFGIRALWSNLAQRGLIGTEQASSS